VSESVFLLAMARRWIVPWAESETKPAIYHTIARVVDRRFAFGPDDKEQFRIYMRMMENFSGCRVLAYCVMCNHFHILLEVPPRPKVALTDEQLLKRLGALYSKAFVATVAKELAGAREWFAQGMVKDGDAYVEPIHERFTYRMHDLSEFMKTLLQRFTRWHNTRSKRRGNLWEETFKSVVVEDGVAAKTIAAYIDLNPVRAGMVADPAEYRWSSYGEAIGCRVKGDSLTRSGVFGNGKTARAGLVRALKAHQGVEADADLWASGVSREYRKLLMAGAVGKTSESVSRNGKSVTKTLRKWISKEEAERENKRDGEIPFGKMLRCRVRYFTDGAVIGSKEFVNEAFASARERFGQKRKDGARKIRGEASVAAGMLWSFRDLRKGI
jgi:putative transposase